MSWADNYDEFCLPDDVLAAIDDLGAAPRPTHAAHAPEVGSMFDAFLPAGPLNPPLEHSVGQTAAETASAPPLLARVMNTSHPEQQRLPGQDHRTLGETQLLRARLQQAEQQTLQERQRVAQLQCDLQAAKSERDSKYEAQLQKLASELSFKSDEAQQANLARSQMQAQLNELQEAMLVGEDVPARAAVCASTSNLSAVNKGAVAATLPSSASNAQCPLIPLASNSPLFHARSMRPSPNGSARKRPCPPPRFPIARESAPSVAPLVGPAASSRQLPVPQHRAYERRTAQPLHRNAAREAAVAEHTEGSDTDGEAPSVLVRTSQPACRAVQGLVSADCEPVAATVTEGALISMEPSEGLLILLRLLALPGLKTLLLERAPDFLQDEKVQQVALSDDLLAAMQLLMTGEDTGPLLLRALLPHVRLTQLDSASSSAWRARASWQLFCHLAVESDYCRDCIIRAHTKEEPVDSECGGGAASSLDSGDVFLQLVEAVTQYSCNPTAADLVFPALRALLALAWDHPGVCLPALHSWLMPDLAFGQRSVFDHLVCSRLPVCARLEALKLLELVLRDERAFLTFTTPNSDATPKSLIMSIALALNPRLATTAAQQWPQGHSLAPCAGGRWPKELSSRLDGMEVEMDIDAFVAEEVTKLGMAPKQALQQAVLRLFSSLVATHADAANRLLSPTLGLALPMRLVSMLQSQVHALLQLHGRPATRGELSLVRETVLLLLEVARTTNMQYALEGGSWSADLTSATLHLVRNEVHPQLADLSTPAKLLQNAMTLHKSE